MKKIYTIILFLALVLLSEIIIAQVTASFTVSGNTAKCANVNYTFTNTSTHATSYYWDFGDGSSSSSPNPTYAYQFGGTYIVSLTATDSNNNSSTYVKGVYVKNAPIPYFSWTDNGGLYPNDTFRFENYSQNATTHLWNFGDGKTSTNIHPKHAYTTPGTKTVSLTTGNGCATPQVFTTQIQVIDTTTVVPKADGFVSSSVSCPNTPVGFYNNSDFYKYVIWNFGDGNQLQTTQEEVNHVYTQKGKFVVKLYAYWNNRVDSTSFDVHITDTIIRMPYSHVTPSQYNVNNELIVAGCTNTLFGLHGSDNDDLKKVYWRLHNGTLLNVPDTNVRFQSTGEYDVWFVAENLCGAKDSMKYTIHVFIADSFDNGVVPILTIPSSGTVCPGGKIKLQAGYSADPNMTYNWKIGTDTFNGKYEIDYTLPSTIGSYQVSLTRIPRCGNIDSTTRNVFTSNLATPSAEFDVNASSHQATCYKDTVRVSLSDKTYELNPVTHFWDFGDGFTSTLAEPNHVYTTPGWQTIIHRTTNACNKTEMSAQTIFLVANISPLPRFYANPVQACPGDIIRFDNFTEKADSMVLEYGDGSKDIFMQGFIPHISHTYANPGKYVTKLYVYNRCSADTAVFTVTILEPAKAEILMNDTTIVAGTTLSINKNTIGAAMHLWQRGVDKKDTSTAGTLTVTFDSTGIYTVYLVSVNEAECMAFDSVTITVIDKPTSLNPLTDDRMDIKLYPNPLSNILNIEYHLSEKSDVSLTIYDINGRQINQVVSQKMEAGKHELSQDLHHISAGVYYCAVRVNDRVQYHKFIKQ